MSAQQELADELARETLEIIEITGDQDLIRQVSERLATSSTVAQEAFLSSVRLRLAINRARAFLKEKRAELNLE
jgi:hypothetical protein